MTLRGVGIWNWEYLRPLWKRRLLELSHDAERVERILGMLDRRFS